MIRRFFHGLSPVGHRCEDKLRWTWRERKGKPKSSSCSKPWLGRTAAAWILHRCRCWCRGPGRCTAGRRMKAGCSETSMRCSASLENVHRMSTLKDAGCLCYLLLESAVFWCNHVLGHCGWIEIVSFGSCNLLRREERGYWHILALVFDGFLLPLTPGHPVQPWNASESQCNAHFDDFFRVCGGPHVEME